MRHTRCLDEIGDIVGQNKTGNGTEWIRFIVCTEKWKQDTALVAQTFVEPDAVGATDCLPLPQTGKVNYVRYIQTLTTSN